MVEYASMDAAQLQQELSSLMQVYQDYQQMKLSLNMLILSKSAGMATITLLRKPYCALILSQLKKQRRA